MLGWKPDSLCCTCDCGTSAVILAVGLDGVWKDMYTAPCQVTRCLSNSCLSILSLKSHKLCQYKSRCGQQWETRQVLVNGKSPHHPGLSLWQDKQNLHITLRKRMVVFVTQFSPFSGVSTLSAPPSNSLKIAPKQPNHKTPWGYHHTLPHVFNFNKYVQHSFHLTYTRFLKFSHASWIKTLDVSHLCGIHGDALEPFSGTSQVWSKASCNTFPSLVTAASLQCFRRTWAGSG